MKFPTKTFSVLWIFFTIIGISFFGIQTILVIAFLSYWIAGFIVILPAAWHKEWHKYDKIDIGTIPIDGKGNVEPTAK